MHDTAEAIGGAFLEANSKAGHVIVELGAFDVNGSIRNYAHPNATYIGVDMEAGPGVDVVAKDELTVPIDSRSADIVVATSVFEHTAFFWVTMLELLRITKVGGLIYVSAPSNGLYHRYPTDNWRFYPDAGKMLERWGRHNGYPVHLVESFIANRRGDMWNDFVAVFQVGPPPATVSFLSDRFGGANVWKIGANEPARVRPETEDMVLLSILRARDRSAREEMQLLHMQLMELRRENGELRRSMRSGDNTAAAAAQPPSGSPETKSPEIAEQERFIEYLEQEKADTRAARARLRELQGLPPSPEGSPVPLPPEIRSVLGPY